MGEEGSVFINMKHVNRTLLQHPSFIIADIISKGLIIFNFYMRYLMANFLHVPGMNIVVLRKACKKKIKPKMT